MSEEIQIKNLQQNLDEADNNENEIDIKKVLVFIIVVALIVTAGIVYWTQFRGGQDIVVPVDVTNLDENKLPVGIPKDLPMEENAQILQNYEAKEQDSNNLQSTRQYISQKSLQENFDLYKKYLEDNNWVILTATDMDDLKGIMAKNNSGEIMDITFSKNQITDEITVDITLSSGE